MMKAPLMMDKKVIWHGIVGDGHFQEFDRRDLHQTSLYIEKCAAQHSNT